MEYRMIWKVYFWLLTENKIWGNIGIWFLVLVAQLLLHTLFNFPSALCKWLGCQDLGSEAAVTNKPYSF